MIEQAREWILNCPNYPTLREFRMVFGWDNGCKILDELIENKEIVIDPKDNTILYIFK